MALKTVLEVWAILSLARKGQVLILLFLMLLTGIAEGLNIISLVPVISVIINKGIGESVAKDYGALGPLLHYLLGLPENIIIGIFIFIIFCVCTLRLSLIWAQTAVAQSIGRDFSVAVFKGSLYQPYAYHLEHNSSEMISGARKAELLCGNFLMPIFSILSAVCLIGFMGLTVLLAGSPYAIGLIFSMGLIFLIIGRWTRKKVYLCGVVQAEQIQNLTKSIQESLGAIRDVLIDSAQEFYVKKYKKDYSEYKRAVVKINILTASPRYVVEAFVLSIAVLALFSSTVPKGQYLASISFAAVLLYTAQRSLPLVNQVYAAVTTMRAGERIAQDVLRLRGRRLEVCLSEDSMRRFTPKKHITLRNVFFKYGSAEGYIFKDLNIRIPLGSKVGVVGGSGAGKSTLFDILMGLLHPTSGSLIIDEIEVNKSNASQWRNTIAHVPQSIYLSDASIAENIAFGNNIKSIDSVRMSHVLEVVELDKFVETLQEGVNTLVGERGVRLSGGQRQRIGLARALYKSAKIIFLDEATNALDKVTEAAILEKLSKFGPDYTIFIISHHKTSLQFCDTILQLKEGNISVINRLQ